MKITTKITLDLQRPNFATEVEVMQDDGETRILEISLASGGTAWNVPAGIFPVVVFRRPNGTKGMYDKLADGSPAVTTEGSTVTVVLSRQMLAIPGLVQASLQFEDAQLNQLTTFPFRVNVQANPYGGAQSVQDVVRLQWLNEKLDEYLKKAAESGEFVGPPGPQGIPGKDGAPGEQGPQGLPGKDGAVGPAGPAGKDGAAGPTGPVGPQGPAGNTGPAGATGPAGKSAYQIAVDGGFVGNEEAWLASLIGSPGQPGPPGKTPVKGVDYWTDAEVQAAEEAVYQRVDGKFSPLVKQAQTDANHAVTTANDAKNAAATADKKVETLREVVSKFHNNIVETASGKSIVLEDASDSGLEGLRLFGRTEQNTTTGKNLWQHGDISGTKSRLRLVLEKGTYTFSRKSGNTNLTFRFYTTENPEDDSNSFLLSCGYEKSKTFTVESHVYYANYNAIGEASKSTEVQIELGSFATPYEVYTGEKPSPNPYYPQALESVCNGGSVGVTVTGKNLLHYPYDHTTKTENGITFTDKGDGSISIEGTSTSDVRFHLIKKDIGNIWRSSDCQLSPYVFSGVPKEIRLEYDPNKKLTLITVPAGVNINTIVYPQVEFGSIATEWEPPREKRGISVYTPNGLPGIKVNSGGNYIDATGQQWICDEVDFARGVYVKRVGSTEGMTWLLSNIASESGGERYMARIPDILRVAYTPAICSHYPFIKSSSFTRPGDYLSSSELGAGIIHIRCADKLFGGADAFNKWVTETNMVVYYILAAPVETQLTPDLLSAYKALHTNYPNTNILNDEGAEMEVRYIADTKLYIDKKFDQLAKAMLENGGGIA